MERSFRGHFRSILLAVVGVFAALSFSGKANIFQGARLSDANMGAYPYSAIGRLFLKRPNGAEAICTATLVAKDLILTAAHCIIDDDQAALAKKEEGRGLPRRDIKQQGRFSFQPALTGGRSAEEVELGRFWISSEYAGTNRERDWAVIEIRQPIGERYGWLGVLDVPLEKNFGRREFSFVGYGNQWRGGDTPSLEKDCSFREKIAGLPLYLHDCSTSRGASGGPIFFRDSAGKHYVAAIDVSSRRPSDADLVGVPYSAEVANIAVPSATFLAKVLELASASPAARASIR